MLALRCLAGVVVLLLATNAHAQGRIRHPVQLEYIRGDGTQTCPPESALHHMITSRMKEDPFVPAAPSKARVAILRVGSAFQGSYELLNDAEQWVGGFTFPRRDDCINALEDVGISVSHHMPLLLSDSTPPPAAPVQEPATVPAKPPTKPPSPTTTATRTTTPVTKKEPASSITGRADLGVIVTSGAAPGTSGGFTLHGGARWSFFSFSIGIRYEFPASAGTETIRGSASRKLLETLPCIHWRRLVGCGLVQIGELTVKGERPSYVGVLNALNAAAGGRIAVEWPFNHWFAGYIAGDLAGVLARTDAVYFKKVSWRESYLVETAGVGMLVLF